jgi:hypothetical protein
MCFANPDGSREIKRYNTQFIDDDDDDDDDGWASAPFDSANPTSETMRCLQHNAQMMEQHQQHPRTNSSFP